MNQDINPMKARRTDSMEIQSQPSCGKLGETTQKYRHDPQSDRNRERQLSEYFAARGYDHSRCLGAKTALIVGGGHV